MVDFKNNSDEKWKAMSPAEKKQELFRRQKDLLVKQNHTQNNRSDFLYISATFLAVDKK